MARKGKSTEENIAVVREAEVRIGQGEPVGDIYRPLGVSEQTYYKWRGEYGGLKMDQAKLLKALEREHERLKKAASERTPDKLIPMEALSEKYCALPVSGRAWITCTRSFPCRSGACALSLGRHERRNGGRRKCTTTKQR